MWVAHLGGHVEAEVLAVLQCRVSQLNTDAAALFERLLQQQRLQNRVKLLPTVLQQHLVEVANNTFSCDRQRNLKSCRFGGLCEIGW